MSIDTLLAVVGIVAPFLAFAGVLFRADLQTRTLQPGRPARAWRQ